MDRAVQSVGLRNFGAWHDILTFTYQSSKYIETEWGCSSAGRASRSQCEGREFDPPQLHHLVPGMTS